MRLHLVFLTLAWICRLFLAYLLITASLGGWVWSEGGIVRVEGKLADPQRFLFQIRALDLFQDPWNAWIAMGLPWLELFTGIGLLLPATALGASAVATGLLGSFLALLLVLSTRGWETIDCGCFGGATVAGDLGWAILGRVLWFAMGAFSTVFLWRRTASRKGQHGHGLTCEKEPPSSGPK